MKSRITLSLLTITLLLSSCEVTPIHSTKSNGKIPPGQMKKATGAKSAKSYAPGQQKKTSNSTSSGNSKTVGAKKKK